MAEAAEDHKHGAKDATEKPKDESKPRCGVVMPIGPADGCTAAHWADVRAFIIGALEDEGFEPSLVSDSAEVSVIHKRILTRLFQDPIVVCDLSALNANVMMELGMRLAFDKPTVILKDGETKINFDAASIEYLQYPRSLRYPEMMDFRKRLADKVTATFEHFRKNPTESPFLKSFGALPAKVETVEITPERLAFEEMREELRIGLSRIERTFGAAGSPAGAPSPTRDTIATLVDAANSRVSWASNEELQSNSFAESNHLGLLGFVFGPSARPWENPDYRLLSIACLNASRRREMQLREVAGGKGGEGIANAEKKLP